MLLTTVFVDDVRNFYTHNKTLFLSLVGVIVILSGYVTTFAEKSWELVYIHRGSSLERKVTIKGDNGEDREVNESCLIKFYRNKGTGEYKYELYFDSPKPAYKSDIFITKSDMGNQIYSKVNHGHIIVDEKVR